MESCYFSNARVKKIELVLSTMSLISAINLDFADFALSRIFQLEYFRNMTDEIDRPILETWSYKKLNISKTKTHITKL